MGGLRGRCPGEWALGVGGLSFSLLYRAGGEVRWLSPFHVSGAVQLVAPAFCGAPGAHTDRAATAAFLPALPQCGLNSRILDVLKKGGFQEPLPIQAQALPSECRRRLLGGAGGWTFLPAVPGTTLCCALLCSAVPLCGEVHQLPTSPPTVHTPVQSS